MVRLKDSFGAKGHMTKVISIPYGSIKRRSEWRHRLQMQISIPYGSIKS